MTAEALTGFLCVERQGGRETRPRHVGERLRFAHPRHRLRKGGIVRESLPHQLIELRIVERAPPYAHLRRRQHLRGEAEMVSCDGLLLRVELRRGNAARDCEGHGNEWQTK